MPASCMIWFPESYHKAQAVVKYNIEAIVTNDDGSILKHEALLLLQEKPVAFNSDIITDQRFLAHSCCCERGEAIVKTKFNKNVFFANEQIQATLSIDMTNVKIALESLSLILV